MQKKTNGLTQFSILLVLLVVQPGYANDSDPNYVEFLKIAQQKAQRQNFPKRANSLSSTWMKKLLGRSYRLGDHWEILAWPFQNIPDWKSNDPTRTQTKLGVPGVFHYEVAHLENGPSPKITVRITQKNKDLDPELKSVQLIFDDQFIEHEKSYWFKGSTKPIQVSPVGILSDKSVIDYYPLDIPEISTAIEKTVVQLPQLPPSVQTSVQFSPNLSESFWFDQDDFFGRPVEILWEKGNPWPSYLKTPQGIAILISKNKDPQ